MYQGSGLRRVIPAHFVPFRGRAVAIFLFGWIGLVMTVLVVPAPPAWGDFSFQTKSCNGNIIKVTITGVSNVELNYEDHHEWAGVQWCLYDFDADFPVPGKEVSISVEPVVASGEELHTLLADIDGIFSFDEDWEPCAGCCETDPPGTPVKTAPQPTSLSNTACYSEATYPFSASADLITSRIVSCDVDEHRTQVTSWIGFSVHARRTYCADDPANCRYT